MGSLFGGSKSKSTSTSTQSSQSGNKAYDYIMGTLSPNVSMGNSAFSQMGALLGLGGDKAAADTGYANYMENSGFNGIMDRAMGAVRGSAAQRGSLNSGATEKALQDRGVQLGKENFGNYLGQLGAMFSGGMQSAGAIGGAGGYSNSSGTSSGSGTSSSSAGIFNSLFPGGLSDRRLKTHLEPLGVNAQGLTVYRFEFINRPDKHIGVMADEVEMMVPTAVSTRPDGYLAVNYELITPLDDYPFTAPVQEVA